MWREIATTIHDWLGRPQRVLDAAAGHGEFINAIPAREKWAIDAVDFLGDRPDVHKVIGDIRDVPLPDAHFDAVFVSNFLEHLAHADEIGALLQRFRRADCARRAHRGARAQLPLLRSHVLRLRRPHSGAHPPVGRRAPLRRGYRIDRVVPRFLPYSFRGVLPTAPALVRAYFALPSRMECARPAVPRDRHEPRRLMRTGATEDRAVRLAFVGVVVAAALVLVYENRDMWFGGDEWFVLTDRGITAGAGHQGALEPFNEHWTTLPILAFRALYSIVGLHSYWPYVALVIVAHLGGGRDALGPDAASPDRRLGRAVGVRGLRRARHRIGEPPHRVAGDARRVARVRAGRVWSWPRRPVHWAWRDGAAAALLLVAARE